MNVASYLGFALWLALAPGNPRQGAQKPDEPATASGKTTAAPKTPATTAVITMAGALCTRTPASVPRFGLSARTLEFDK